MVNKRKISWAKSTKTRGFNSTYQILLAKVKLSDSNNFNPHFLKFFCQCVLVLLTNLDVLSGEGTYFNRVKNIFWIGKFLANSGSVINVPNNNRFDGIELSKRINWVSDMILAYGPFCRSVLLSKRKIIFLLPLVHIFHFNYYCFKNNSINLMIKNCW